jgi:hypothetical protein
MMMGEGEVYKELREAFQMYRGVNEKKENNRKQRGQRGTQSSSRFQGIATKAKVWRSRQESECRITAQSTDLCAGEEGLAVGGKH